MLTVTLKTAKQIFGPATEGNVFFDFFTAKKRETLKKLVLL